MVIPEILFWNLGGIGVWHLIKWFNKSSFVAYQTEDPKRGGTSYLDMVKMPNELGFARVINMTIEKDFHRLLQSDREPLLSMRIHLSHVGNTSWNTISILTDENSGKVLATFRRKMVFINEVTRKPKPLPDWWKSKYAPAVVESQELVMPSLEVPTQNTYKYTMKTTWNDTDYNKHVNNANYVVFCFDAAMEATRNNFYVGFHGDILSYDVKALSMSFLKDAKADDSLTIITWQDVHNPKILYFSIEKDDEIIYQNSIEFFLRSYL